MNSSGETVEARLAAVRERVAAAAARAGRSEDEIQLLGASKIQTPDTIAAALRGGLGLLGENYVQEAAEKRPRIEALAASQGFAAPRWHLIGALQRNKAKRAVELFDVVESVDRTSLANALARAAAAREGAAPLEIFLQVNLSGEAQKAGVAEAELEALFEHCVACPDMSVAGLMTIPAPVDDPEDNRPVFARLRAWRDRLQARDGGQSLQALSMGMSRDFEIAIEEGATVVRVGSDLFGPRPAKGASAPT